MNVEYTVRPQRWAHQVDGALWRCYGCGWLGEHHYSSESAEREALRHMAEAHPGANPVLVTEETPK